MNVVLLVALLGCPSRNSAVNPGAQAEATPTDAEAPVAAAEPAAPEPEAPNGCVRWLAAPKLLSPEGGEPRHHASIAWRPGGGLLAAWQVGKDPARVVTRAFDPALVPVADEVLASAGDKRATHPAIATHGAGATLVWTREDDGALLVAALDADGRPTGTPAVIDSGSTAPARYGDVSYGTSGEAVVGWFRDRSGAPSWPHARLVGGRPGSTVVPPTLPGTNTGGPGTVRHDASGTAWGAWFELAAAPERGGEATLRVARLGATAPEVVHDAWRSGDNLQRTALAFVGDRLVVGWTRYPTRAASWAIGFTVVGPDGRALPGAGVPEAASGARMIDLDAAGGAIVAGWEAPSLGEDRELWLRVFDRDGKPRCSPTLAHRPHPDEDARAQIVVREVDGVVRGVIAWQRGPHARKQAVWARPFEVVPR
jgi:hypothetical protein